MGWQADIFARLRDREWRQVGSLFEEFETQIPLHIAMRYAMNPRRKLFNEMPTTTQARWVVFLHCLSEIGVEREGGEARSRKWTDQVRLRYVAERNCAACGGPVIKSTWMARTGVTCLACEATPVTPTFPPSPQAEPLAALGPPAAKPPAPQPVVVVAHVVACPPRRRRQSDRHRAKMAAKQKSRRGKLVARNPLGDWCNYVIGWLQRWAANNPAKARGPPLGAVTE